MVGVATVDRAQPNAQIWLFFAIKELENGEKPQHSGDKERHDTDVDLADRQMERGIEFTGDFPY